jgi:hypothetical protein
MSKSGENTEIQGDDVIEALLRKAAPRPTPPSEDEQIVRDAVTAEWKGVAGKVKMRQRMTQFAIAATVLLGVAISFNALQVSNVQPVKVATIERNQGAIYLVGEQSLMQEASDLSSVYVGQIIETGNDAAISLEWGNGGSLRIDKNTRIEFTTTDSVYLRSGQVYFDSQPATMAAITGAGFEIETDHGLVKHLGTQYMTTVGARALIVRVREGEVSVDGTYVEQSVAVAGKQVTVSGGATLGVLDIDAFGEIWAWAEEMAPTIDMDGRSTHDFLQMTAREIGLVVEYESDAAKIIARGGILRGAVELDPRSELEFRMAGEDLGYRIDGGTIYVSIDSSSRQ